MMISLSKLSRLRWCFSSLGCPEYSLREIIGLAEARGIELVELRCVSGETDIPQVAKVEDWLTGKHSGSLSLDEVAITALNSSARVSKPFDECYRELEAFAPLMSHFEVPHLRVFDGDLDMRHNPEEAWHWLDAWERMRKRRKWSFSLLVETHDSLLTADEVARFFYQGHEHVGLLWDSHHTWRKKNLCPLESWSELRPWIRHVHIKDSLPIPGSTLPYSYVCPGNGDFPLWELIQTLENDSFDGPVSLEWERRWHPSLPPLELALDRLSQFIATSK